MLSSLIIRNVVLIEHLDLQFREGFCALTGETGAGKSILLDSLGLALGGRSDSGLVRKGAGQASVAAEFHVSPDHPVHAILEDQGLDSDTTLILRRVLGKDGRSRAFINDQPVSIGLLREAGNLLVEVHSQFETHGLLDARTHRALLDDYAGITKQAQALDDLWERWKGAERKLTDAIATAEKARADEEYLRHAVGELDSLNPREGEEDQLLTQREALKAKDHVRQALDESWEMISGDAGAEILVSRASRALERIPDNAAIDTTEAIDTLDRVAEELQAAVRVVQAALHALDEGGMTLEEIEDRLYTLRDMARKHRVHVADLPRLYQDYTEKLSFITNTDAAIAALKKDVAAGKAVFIAAAKDISAARIAAAEKLDKAVAKELPPLKLDKARFVTSVQTGEDESAWGPDGIDKVQFLVATNPGAEPGPLGKIASGGEMSRFMLSIKVVMAALGAAPSLVFDEVDSGIGGSTADAVGERLARLSKTKQILVVTHAPQVAARANHHYIVMKSGEKDLRTTVIPLDELNDRKEEIARMLSGATITTEARAAAQKLLDTGT
jgi:DNA repair protein RecN (Recombination protein N)